MFQVVMQPFIKTYEKYYKVLIQKWPQWLYLNSLVLLCRIISFKKRRTPPPRNYLRSNIKKHIWKLFVSGAISTDPFEILNTERRFYEILQQTKH